MSGATYYHWIELKPSDNVIRSMYVRNADGRVIANLIFYERAKTYEVVFCDHAATHSYVVAEGAMHEAEREIAKGGHKSCTEEDGGK